MDIDPVRLEQARSIVQAVVDRRNLGLVKARPIAVWRSMQTRCDDFQREAGAYKLISKFRKITASNNASAIRWGRRRFALRTIPVLLDLCDGVDELAPGALLSAT
jgi:hypothetical protein